MVILIEIDFNNYYFLLFTFYNQYLVIFENITTLKKIIYLENFLVYNEFWGQLKSTFAYFFGFGSIAQTVFHSYPHLSSL